MSIISPVATLLVEARNRRAYSQRALAEVAGTAQSVVGRIEAGMTSPTIDTLMHLLESAGFDLRMEIVPRRVADPVIEAYKPGVDRTLLVENLRRTVDERLQMNAEVQYFSDELRRALRVAEGAP